METLKMTGRPRETYEVQLTYSLLWECALGIAAITNSKLLKTLEKPEKDWNRLRESLSEELQSQLNFVEKNNTWKSLLQILHQKEFEDLDDYISYIEKLDEVELRFMCLPITGRNDQRLRQSAAQGDRDAVQSLMIASDYNPFFPQYIEFISQHDASLLKKHLVRVITLWFKEVVTLDAIEREEILKRDFDSKQTLKQKLTSEELVQVATGGISYIPEPSVHTVLLIPQYIYRPWSIEADIEGVKVFYYPVSNESVSPGDRYTPDQFLVLKHKALGDEGRLKIVKLLSEKNRTLQDITGQLNMGKSTVHHHLKILRSAKLVETSGSQYKLKKDALELMYKEIKLYLEQPVN
ncbi:ArsR/SmtB family transcription factor [Jeotgalibacillus haloalkalitolerans]|uniref:Metalloregulator ArsR/SmtB family transcription factor n=1 Tax=Jeotgalibacillus haloalkalitolerans TaxID=3104292 RepID=A0ABU5KHH8_9BACL|nr:metalloregulator ArsR/SmtB family transcription factor [Jeotgalibacillus sp. HH7-29]MDZ5710697.1 metalloregulator ArsR/SmtB family transcription factor [Jeotgalibacillus sp. HH7-29]